MKTAMNSSATKPSENEIGMPENITTKVTPPNKSPSESTLIDVPFSRALSASREMRRQLQCDLRDKQRHPERHQSVRDRQRGRERRRRRHLVDPRLMKQRPRFPCKERAKRKRQRIDDDDPHAIGRWRKNRCHCFDANVAALRLNPCTGQKDGADDAEYGYLVLPIRCGAE